MKAVRLRSFIPPVGEPILPRLKGQSTEFDWSFGGRYQPVFVDSGTTALRLAVEVSRLHLGRAGPVWVPGYGCPDILAACLGARSEPVLYDVAVGSPFVAAGQKPPADMVAVIAAHFLGLLHPSDVVQAVVRRTDAILIEDSAQRFPMPGERLFGDAVVLSFGRGKPVSLMEGGCLLVKDYLFPLATEVASSYGKADAALAGGIRRWLHDMSIQPAVYNLIRQLPGLAIGRVALKPSPPPEVFGQHLQNLASRAAAAYQRECGWNHRQQRTVEFADVHVPGLQSLGKRLGQDNRRLLRMPFWSPDPETSRHACAKLNAMGVGATRMYGRAHPFIAGVPEGIRGDWRQADEFAQRLVTLPILPVNPAAYLE